MSDGLGQRHQRVAHDAAVLFLVATGDLDLAQAGRVLHHHAAALPAPVFERRQGLVHRLLAGQGTCFSITLAPQRVYKPDGQAAPPAATSI